MSQERLGNFDFVFIDMGTKFYLIVLISPTKPLTEVKLHTVYSTLHELEIEPIGSNHIHDTRKYWKGLCQSF